LPHTIDKLTKDEVDGELPGLPPTDTEHAESLEPEWTVIEAKDQIAGELPALPRAIDKLAKDQIAGELPALPHAIDKLTKDQIDGELPALPPTDTEQAESWEQEWAVIEHL